MSGAMSLRKRSTISSRKRTELMFQEAIFMMTALAGVYWCLKRRAFGPAGLPPRVADPQARTRARAYCEEAKGAKVPARCFRLDKTERPSLRGHGARVNRAFVTLASSGYQLGLEQQGGIPKPISVTA